MHELDEQFEKRIRAAGRVASDPTTVRALNDLVVARDWVDVDGTWLGACESRLALEAYPDEVEDLLRDYLTGLDTSTLEPDAQEVAVYLKAMNRLDRLSQLIADAADLVGDTVAAAMPEPSSCCAPR